MARWSHLIRSGAFGAFGAFRTAFLCLLSCFFLGLINLLILLRFFPIGRTKKACCTNNTNKQRKGDQPERRWKRVPACSVLSSGMRILKRISTTFLAERKERFCSSAETAERCKSSFEGSRIKSLKRKWMRAWNQSIQERKQCRSRPNIDKSKQPEIIKWKKILFNKLSTNTVRRCRVEQKGNKKGLEDVIAKGRGRRGLPKCQLTWKQIKDVNQKKRGDRSLHSQETRSIRKSNDATRSLASGFRRRERRKFRNCW